jgi:undecaprenyl-diphosphatase
MGNLGARLLALDAAVTARLVLKPARPAALRAALVLAHSGDIYVWGALCATAWLLGDRSWKLSSLLAAAGLVATQAIVTGIKYAVRRQRPAGTAGGIYRKADPYSFPSGHGARAAFLIILACRFGPFPLAAAVCVWAPLMALSRVMIGVHWALDVVGGILLGSAIAAAALWLTPAAAEWAGRLAAVIP